MLIRLENPNSLVVLLSVQVSPAQLGHKQLKNTPPLLNVFTILVCFNFKYNMNSQLLYSTVRQKRVWRGRGRKKEAVYPTTSSIFDVAGSRIININISSSHYS